jgi:hypothetical protein
MPEAPLQDVIIQPAWPLARFTSPASATLSRVMTPNR